jgi:Predicted acyl-CoA transferases/carnitine dehydratase
LLTGLQVLDLADERASFCSKLLADFGVEVIKIERLGGDASRWIGPFWGNIPHPEKSLSFLYNNTNKLGITLNLERREGREILRQLASKSDVIIETFLPGHLEKLGLGYEILASINPRLILVSVTGFGQSGPYKQYKSCDIVASATGGQMYVCGAPDTPPLKPYGEQSYYVASIFAAIGILIALRERNRSGKGQHIDISQQEAVAATLEHVLVDYFYDSVVSQRQGSSRYNDSFCLLPCKDGHILLTIDMNWDILVDWLDSEGMAKDLKEERWREEEYRRQHWDHIIDILTLWTKTHTRAELFELGQLMRLPWAPVSTLEEMVNSAQLIARNFFVSVKHPELTNAGPRLHSYKYPGTPYRFFAREAENNKIRCNVRRAPLIGEHNARVYQEKLGLSTDDLERLSANKVI